MNCRSVFTDSPPFSTRVAKPTVDSIKDNNPEGNEGDKEVVKKNKQKLSKTVYDYPKEGCIRMFGGGEQVYKVDPFITAEEMRKLNRPEARYGLPPPLGGIL